MFPFWYHIRKKINDVKPISGKGWIHIINVLQEPYEIIIYAGSDQFHIFFGSQGFGRLLYIPDLKLECELGSYHNSFNNINSIASSGQIAYEYACAIGNALDLISILLGKNLKE